MTFEACDVTNYDALATIFDKTFKENKQLSFVAANAGVPESFSLYSTIEAVDGLNFGGIPPEPNMACMRVNLDGVLYCAWLGVHYMRRNTPPGGVITATASIAGQYPTDILPVYCASKHGVVGLVKGCGRVLSLENIRVNCVCPGRIGSHLISY